MRNPLLEIWKTSFQSPPFKLIRIEHFRPAIEETIRSTIEEIKSITENHEQPSFENTIAALDSAGEKLGDITAILFNLNSAETCRELQSVALEISPLLARFSNDITLNEKLFARIRYVFESKETAGLNTEQTMLLEKTWRNFILGGAGLDENQKQRFREISEELSQLSVKFEENVLEDTNSFELHITDKNDLVGLPEGTREMAEMEARNRNKEGWIFTLHFPSYVPFMKYSDNRHLREIMFKAYSSRSFHGDKYDNRGLACRISELRLQLACILNYRNFAEMALIDRMADTVPKVETFLEELHIAAFPAAQRDFDSVSKYATENGHTGPLEDGTGHIIRKSFRKQNSILMMKY